MMLPVLAAVMAVVEPSSGLQVPIPAEFECVYLPATPLNAGCRELSAEVLEGFKKQGIWLYAVKPETTTVLTGMLVSAKGSFMGDAELNNFVAGVASGMEKAGKFTPIARGRNSFVITMHNDVTVAEFTLTGDLETQKEHPSLAFSEMALIPMESSIISLAEYTAERDGLLAEALKGLKGAPHFQGDLGGFGKNSAYRLGRLVGTLAVPLAVVLLGFIAVVRKLAGAKTT